MELRRIQLAPYEAVKLKRTDVPHLERLVDEALVLNLLIRGRILTIRFVLVDESSLTCAFHVSNLIHVLQSQVEICRIGTINVALLCAEHLLVGATQTEVEAATKIKQPR